MGKSNATPYIGSYVLETLTTGMYGQSANALREYVQNSFDSIRQAVRLGMMLKEEGRIDVSLTENNNLVIRDNGTGIASQAAWGTLTSVGASKKDRTRDAGFRGIGRLAGIAFCESLIFRTKASDDEKETTVTFDCVALRAGMNPDTGGTQNLADLISTAVSIDTAQAEDVTDHFMEVTLSGLEHAPALFTDVDQIRDYLAQTSPVAFNPKWPGGKDVLSKAKKADWSIETVKLFVKGPENPEREVFKLYRTTLNLEEGKSQNILTVDDRAGSKRSWWAWFGVPDTSGAVVDDQIHGLRVRVKNIQIDSTTILDEIFGSENASKVRFNKWYVGEVHIDPTLLIPNARRDGFEDTDAWSALKAELYSGLCSDLAQTAYKLSGDRQKSIEKIEADVTSLTAKTAKYVASGKESDQRHTLLSEVAKQRGKIAKALKDALPDTQLRFKAQLEYLEAAKASLVKAPEAPLKDSRKSVVDQILEQVLLTLQAYLEPELFVTVRRALKDKIK